MTICHLGVMGTKEFRGVDPATVIVVPIGLETTLDVPKPEISDEETLSLDLRVKATSG